MAVKENQPTLYEQVKEAIDEALEQDAEDIEDHQSRGEGHGRHETRTYAIFPKPELVDPLELWRDLSALVGIAISRQDGRRGRQSMETRYYILSRQITACEFAGRRGHWGIGNNLHWQLDVSFREDQCRVCRDHAAANSVIRRLLRWGFSNRETSLPRGSRSSA